MVTPCNVLVCREPLPGRLVWRVVPEAIVAVERVPPSMVTAAESLNVPVTASVPPDRLTGSCAVMLFTVSVADAECVMVTFPAH